MSLFRTFGNSLSAAFAAAWGNTTPIALENRVFDPPSNAPWVRLSIIPSDSRQVTIGSPSLTRHIGMVYVTVFTPVGEGTERSNWLIDKAADFFSKTGVSLATFQTPYPNPGADNGEGWFAVNLVCPYWFDELC